MKRKNNEKSINSGKEIECPDIKKQFLKSCEKGCKTKKGKRKYFRTFKTFRRHMFEVHDVIVADEILETKIGNDFVQDDFSDLTNGTTDSVCALMKKNKIEQ